MSDDQLRGIFDRALGAEPPMGGSPLDDLRRGKGALRRRRIVTAASSVAGVAVIVAGVAIGVNLLNGDKTSDYAGGPKFSDWRTALQPLDAKEMAQLCAPQLRKERPDVPATAWKVELEGPKNRVYHLGDTVTVTAKKYNRSTQCELRGTWVPDRPVHEAAPAPASGDHAAILERCSGLIGVDVRSWQVAAAMSDGKGGLSATLASPDDDPLLAGCLVEPSTWENSTGSEMLVTFGSLSKTRATYDKGHIVTRLRQRGVAICGASPACDGRIYALNGTVMPDVARMTATLSDGKTVDIPVRDGQWALRVVDPQTGNGPGALWISAYDEAGKRLTRFDAGSDNPDDWKGLRQ